MNGTVTRAFLPNGYAFVQGDDGQTYFFQAQQLYTGMWDGATIHTGVRVTFTPVGGGTKGNGLRATEVRIA